MAIKSVAVLLGTALALGLAANSSGGCESESAKRDRQMQPLCTDSQGWVIDCPEKKK